MNSILDQIVRVKRTEIEDARSRRPLPDCKAQARHAPPVRSFFDALAQPGPIKLIAEVKKASPSQGIIREDFDPVSIAESYQLHGASCISVLTDSQFFQGHLDYLSRIRDVVSIPVLRKDFILDSYQLWEARAAGADAVLLIAECLDDCNLRKLFNETLEIGMTPLVECYEQANVERVLEAGATLIGVNNRDLNTFQTDLGHTLRLKSLIPAECLLVAESGIHSRADVRILEEAGVDAMLVGESLMRKPDLGQAVRDLLGTN